jgi:CheY-like chemotaxis protein
MTDVMPILLIEDSDADAEALRRVVKKLGLPLELKRCSTGACALDYLHLRGTHSEKETAPRPAFILLDYHLPDMSGDEVLEAIKSEDRLKAIPVIGFSGATNPRDVQSMYQEGASSFVPKPHDAEALRLTTEKMMAYWLALVMLPEEDSA